MKWAIVGLGRIAVDFALALRVSEEGALHAVGSACPDRAAAFAREHRAPVSGSYAEVIRRSDVEAVYVSTVHTQHESLVCMALEAGKAVLCEKPLTTSLAGTERVIETARRTGGTLLEGYRHRFGPLADRLRGLLESGAIGRPLSLHASFGFVAPRGASRLFRPDLGGGGILDVGGYPLSLAIGVAGWSRLDVSQAALRDSHVERGPTGVDERSSATIGLDGFTSHVTASIVDAWEDPAVIVGSMGNISVDDAWGGRHASPRSLTITTPQGGTVNREFRSVNPLAAEADSVCRARRSGETQVKNWTWADALHTARLLDDWRCSDEVAV